MGALHAAAMWAGLNIALLLALSILVVRQRLSGGVALGDGGKPALARAIRVHGNASEYIPVCLAGIAIMALAGQPAWTIHVGGALLLGGRIAHAVGMAGSDGPSPGRQAGMVATYTAMGWIAVWCLIGAI
jgi:uncharacterized protein